MTRALCPSKRGATRDGRNVELVYWIERIADDYLLCLVLTADTDNTVLSCLVRVGDVKRIGDKSRLSASENFETVLFSFEM